MEASGLRLPASAVLPCYDDQGIYGLAHALHAFIRGEDLVLQQTPYPDIKTVVFLLIDGLGDAFLCRHGQHSALLSQRRGRLTSVFPSTTATAVTTFMTGLSPAEHGLTGWFIFDRHTGVCAPLPFQHMDGSVLEEAQQAVLFSYPSGFDGQSKRCCIHVSPAQLVASPYSRFHCGKAHVLPYESGLSCLYAAILQACQMLERSGGFVYAYYPEFDALSHHFGCESSAVIEEFWRIDRFWQQLAATAEMPETCVIASADHGFIDNPPSQKIVLEKQLSALLSAPLFGEMRSAFCRVRPGAGGDFVAGVTEFLDEHGMCAVSRDLVEHGLFGPGQHAALSDRVGDYTLLMQSGWTVLAPECPPPEMVGVHGGLSPQEMWVPLIHAGGHC